MHILNHGYFPIVDDDIPNVMDATLYSMYYYAAYAIDNYTSKKVLDVGCCRGGGIASLAPKLPECKLYGCDVNSDYIEHAKKEFGSIVNFQNQDILDNNYENDYFDVVMSIQSLHENADLPKFIDNVQRILKTGGLFICVDVIKPETREFMQKWIDEETDLSLISVEDITENVISSCAVMLWRSIQSDDIPENKTFIGSYYGDNLNKYIIGEQSMIKYLFVKK